MLASARPTNAPALRLITAPAAIVSVAEMKAHLRYVDDDLDALITDMIAGATSYLDAYGGVLGRALGLQTWEVVLDRFPCASIEIPLGPLVSVTSVKYDDTDGVEQTVSSANYVVDTSSLTGWVVPLSSFSWPDTLDGVNAVRVRFVAGSATVDKADTAIVKLIVTDWFMNRGSGGGSNEIPPAAEALIKSRRRLNI